MLCRYLVPQRFRSKREIARFYAAQLGMNGDDEEAEDEDEGEGEEAEEEDDVDDEDGEEGDEEEGADATSIATATAPQTTSSRLVTLSLAVDSSGRVRAPLSVSPTCLPQRAAALAAKELLAQAVKDELPPQRAGQAGAGHNEGPEFYMACLREYLQAAGCRSVDRLLKGWTCQVFGSTGSRRYAKYTSPNGQGFVSRAEVARHHNLNPISSGQSHAITVAVRQAASAATTANVASGSVAVDAAAPTAPDTS